MQGAEISTNGPPSGHRQELVKRDAVRWLDDMGGLLAIPG